MIDIRKLLLTIAMALMLGSIPMSAPDEVVIVKTQELQTSTSIYISQETIKPACVYSVSDIDLLSMIVMAEAKGEPEEGKRLVIDTILNRVDSGRYANTIAGVIYQKGQFTSMINGRCNRVSVTNEVRELVNEELSSRTNSDVLYFTAGHYGSNGVPLFNVGNHYFCK